jgi:hypothetical protein
LRTLDPHVPPCLDEHWLDKGEERKAGQLTPHL